ncbi:MAG: hypothetical protein ACRBN8_27560 [Nannocystales bacterium]
MARYLQTSDAMLARTRGRTFLSAAVFVGSLVTVFDAGAASSDAGTCRSSYIPGVVSGLPADEVSSEGVVPIALWDFPVETPGLGMVEVIDPAGVPLVGSLEVVASRVIVWRPDEPLVPGLVYSVTASTDDPEQRFAVPDNPTAVLQWSFVAAGARPSTAASEEIITGLDYVVSEQLVGGSLVCCDGAFPVLSGHGDSLCFKGLCGSTFANGSLNLSVELAVATPAAVAANTFARRVGLPTEDGEQSCYTVVATDLTTASETELERCHTRPPGQTGMVDDHDPVPALLEVCTQEPYVCGIHRESDQGWDWNPEDCQPVTELEDLDPELDEPASGESGEAGAEDTQGCACQAGLGVSPMSFLGAPLLLFGLASRWPRGR